MSESIKNNEHDPARLAKKFARFIDRKIIKDDLPFSADIEVDVIDDTYIIENEDFLLSFTIEDGVFAILSIEVTRRENGYGRTLIEIVHEFSEKNNLPVEARKVEADAIGFWETMGYEEGTEPGTYHYNG